ncbi:MAG: AbrB/MazE/SpoVT family DNA-binding domain-containing protein [Chloroflexaceae bacterium]|jgi:antitoxin MazE|nr:AbrB/MazE/SpoVT family DNA-binding domain-containing protein [Chloroflexaceae bacterium]
MKGRVQKWGNSLALRIPKTFAEEVGISDNALVDISLTDGKILIAPAEQPASTLDDLLAAIMPEQLHAEQDSGPPQGGEVW